MSQLRARNGSELRGIIGSELRNFGIGGETLEFPSETEVSMEFSCSWMLTDGTNILNTWGGSVKLHERFYHCTLASMGRSTSGNDTPRGLAVSGYSAGTPDLVNDTRISNGLTPSSGGNGCAYNRWQQRAVNEPGSIYRDGLIDTGTTMEFYGETNFTTPGTLIGAYSWGPGLGIPFNGSFNERAALDHIIHYFEVDGSITIAGGQDLWLRHKLVITA